MPALGPGSPGEGNPGPKGHPAHGLLCALCAPSAGRNRRHGVTTWASQPPFGAEQGSYPGDYSRAFAFCRILYPLASGAGHPDPSGIPRGIPQPTGLPSSECDTWGIAAPSRP